MSAECLTIAGIYFVELNVVSCFMWMSFVALNLFFPPTCISYSYDDCTTQGSINSSVYVPQCVLHKSPHICKEMQTLCSWLAVAEGAKVILREYVYKTDE